MQAGAPPCVLVLDASMSMDGEAIKQLNEGLKALEFSLKYDAKPSDFLNIVNLGHINLLRGNENEPNELYRKGLAHNTNEEIFKSKIEDNLKYFTKKGWHTEESQKVLKWIRKEHDANRIPSWLLG